jgi:hypothetical protein
VPRHSPENQRVGCHAAVRRMLRVAAAVLVFAWCGPARAQPGAGGLDEGSVRFFETGERGWPVPLISRATGEAGPGWLPEWLRREDASSRAVWLDESAGTLAPVVRAGSDSLDVLEFPLLTGPAEVDFVSFPRIRLPTLGLPTLFGRIRGEYADDFDTQSRIGGSAHLRTSQVYGFDLEWNYRRTDLARSRHDKLWTGDANFVYQLVNVDMVSMRAGGGIAWLADEDESDVGFNITYGADFWIKQPWLVTLELDFGRVDGNSLTHARGTIGYVWGQWELYTGWDWFEIGHREFDGVIGGVTLWF